MNPEKFAEEIRFYNSIVIDDQVATKEDLVSLSSSLSKLLDLGERLPDLYDDHEYEPQITFEEMKDKISNRFVDFSSYSNADPDINLVGDMKALTVGDALDDLVDIYIDLNTALAYFENGVWKNMFWHARLMFGHWGRHAIDLKSYLHQKLHGW
ncbi:MAG: DUF5063 domain-containing protein [Pseudomonadota bacterium]